MKKIRIVILWLIAVMLFVSCAASRKVEQGSSEQRRDSVVTSVIDSVAKSETSTDSTVSIATTEQLTTGTMTDKGSNEETIIERVTESVDVSGNRTTTTDRTIHRKGDYERNATYEARMKHQEETISRMQHTIDSLFLSNRLNVGTHWAKKDSTSVQKETNTQDVKSTLTFRSLIALFLLWTFLIVMFKWLNKK